MSDGSIVIDLEIDKKPAIEDLKETSKIVTAETKEMEKELTKTINTMDRQAKKVSKVHGEFKSVSTRIKEIETETANMYNKMYQGQKKIGTVTVEQLTQASLEQNKEYQRLLLKRKALSDQGKMEQGILAKQKEDYKNIAKKVDEKKAEEKKVNELLQKQLEQSKLLRKAENKRSKETRRIKVENAGITKVIGGGIKKLAKLALTLVGIRAIYTAITTAVNTWLNGTDEKAQQLKTDIEYLKYAFADMLSPAIEYVVGLLYKMLGLANAIIKSFTGVDVLAKFLAKYTEKTNKEMKGTLASFDQLEVYNGEKKKEPSSFEAETEQFQSVGDKLKQFWADFTSDMDFENLIKSFDRLKESALNLINVSWDVLKDTYEHFLKPVATMVVNNLLPTFFDFLSRVLNELALILETIQPYWIWFMDNVLTPLADWVINEFLPNFFELLAAALELLRPVLEVILPIFQDLFEYVLIPIAKWTGGLIIEIIKGLTEAFRTLGEWIRENKESLKVFIEIVLGFFAGIWIYNSAKKLVPFLSDLGFAFITLFQQMKDYGVITTLTNLLKVLIGTLDVARLSATLCAGGFGALVVAILQIVANWDKMNGIERTVSILGAIAIAAATAAAAIGALQSAWSLGIAAAAIVAGTLAISASVGSAQKRAQQEAEALARSNADIPKLAKGGIVHQPTQAIIGEAGREAVLPLENNTDWMDDLASRINSGGNVNIKFTGSLAQLGRVLKPVIENETNRVGTRLIKGGVGA